MGKQPDEKINKDIRHFDDPDWSPAMALAWITLPTEENVEAAASGHGIINEQAIDKLTSALRLARHGLVATGLFEDERYARKIDADLWAALKIDIWQRTVYPPPTPPSPTTVRMVTVRSKILGPALPGALLRVKRYAPIDGVTVPSRTIKKLFPAQPQRLTAQAETRCRAFLMQLMKDTPDRAPKPKADILADCQMKFPGLSMRAFDRQWGIAIAETGASWNEKGRRKKLHTGNPAPN